MSMRHDAADGAALGTMPSASSYYDTQGYGSQSARDAYAQYSMPALPSASGTNAALLARMEALRNQLFRVSSTLAGVQARTAALSVSLERSRQALFSSANAIPPSTLRSGSQATNGLAVPYSSAPPLEAPAQSQYYYNDVYKSHTSPAAASSYSIHSSHGSPASYGSRTGPYGSSPVPYGLSAAQAVQPPADMFAASLGQSTSISRTPPASPLVATPPHGSPAYGATPTTGVRYGSPPYSSGTAVSASADAVAAVTAPPGSSGGGVAAGSSGSKRKAPSLRLPGAVEPHPFELGSPSGRTLYVELAPEGTVAAATHAQPQQAADAGHRAGAHPSDGDDEGDSGEADGGAVSPLAGPMLSAASATATAGAARPRYGSGSGSVGGGGMYDEDDIGDSGEMMGSAGASSYTVEHGNVHAEALHEEHDGFHVDRGNGDTAPAPSPAAAAAVKALGVAPTTLASAFVNQHGSLVLQELLGRPDGGHGISQHHQHQEPLQGSKDAHAAPSAAVAQPLALLRLRASGPSFDPSSPTAASVASSLDAAPVHPWNGPDSPAATQPTSAYRPFTHPFGHSPDLYADPCQSPTPSPHRARRGLGRTPGSGSLLQASTSSPRRPPTAASPASGPGLSPLHPHAPNPQLQHLLEQDDNDACSVASSMDAARVYPWAPLPSPPLPPPLIAAPVSPPLHGVASISLRARTSLDAVSVCSSLDAERVHPWPAAAGAWNEAPGTPPGGGRTGSGTPRGRRAPSGSGGSKLPTGRSGSLLSRMSYDAMSVASSMDAARVHPWPGSGGGAAAAAAGELSMGYDIAGVSDDGGGAPGMPPYGDLTGFTSADYGGFLTLPDGSLDLMSAVPGAVAAAAVGGAPLSPRDGYISDEVPAAQRLVGAGSSLTHSPLVEVVAGEEGLGARGTGGGGGCSSDEDEAEDYPPVRLLDEGTRRGSTATLDEEHKEGVNGARQETGEEWRARMLALLGAPAGRDGAAGSPVGVSPHGLVRTTGAFGSGEGGPGRYAAAGEEKEQEDSEEEAAGYSSDGTGLGSEVEAGAISLAGKHRDAGLARGRQGSPNGHGRQYTHAWDGDAGRGGAHVEGGEGEGDDGEEDAATLASEHMPRSDPSFALRDTSGDGTGSESAADTAVEELVAAVRRRSGGGGAMAVPGLLAGSQQVQQTGGGGSCDGAAAGEANATGANETRESEGQHSRRLGDGSGHLAGGAYTTGSKRSASAGSGRGGRGSADGNGGGASGESSQGQYSSTFSFPPAEVAAAAAAGLNRINSDGGARSSYRTYSGEVELLAVASSGSFAMAGSAAAAVAAAAAAAVSGGSMAGMPMLPTYSPEGSPRPSTAGSSGGGGSGGSRLGEHGRQRPSRIVVPLSPRSSLGSWSVASPVPSPYGSMHGGMALWQGAAKPGGAFAPKASDFSLRKHLDITVSNCLFGESSDEEYDGGAPQQYGNLYGEDGAGPYQQQQGHAAPQAQAGGQGQGRGGDQEQGVGEGEEQVDMELREVMERHRSGSGVMDLSLRRMGYGPGAPEAGAEEQEEEEEGEVGEEDEQAPSDGHGVVPPEHGAAGESGVVAGGGAEGDGNGGGEGEGEAVRRHLRESMPFLLTSLLSRRVGADEELLSEDELYKTGSGTVGGSTGRSGRDGPMGQHHGHSESHLGQGHPHAGDAGHHVGQGGGAGGPGSPVNSFMARLDAVADDRGVVEEEEEGEDGAAGFPGGLDDAAVAAAQELLLT